MADDPFELFDAWFAEAKVAEINDPEAMALATSTPDGHPSVRIVLLKGHGPQGFDFYTNLDSRKGAELDADPRAALLFHWKSLRRQVRVEGPVELLPAEESDMYFASRGRDSQIGAWASDQSRPLQSREAFERRCEEVRRRYEGREVPRPERWGGFRLRPETFEFWSDRPHRLHERRLFTRTASGWDEGLLYP
ncbi:MAG TPA: pyridoxamine 5'-phosphate oxidase [Sphingomicrobium sp.]|nr:pyridoxamine 5'-phosphate oxidase [Sphingomicrobium sp.]